MNATLTERLWGTGISLRAGDTELPLQSVDIEATVDGNGVIWVVSQTFVNTLEEAIEAEYTFPLPAGGAVNAVQMHIGDRVVEAEIKERGEARVEYEEAVASGHTAAIVEQDRAEIFTVAVGNIHPAESISIVMTIHDSVARDGNEASVRMPTLVKNRYVPAGVPDAPRVSPPRHGGSVHVNSTVKVTFTLPADDLVCDTVVDAVLSPVSAAITDFSLDRDIVLRWQVPAESFEAKWVPDASDPGQGTIEVTLRTDTQPDAGNNKKKAVSILLDRSGSMGTTEMEMAKQIVLDVVNSLGKDDKVHVLTFDSVVEALEPCTAGLIPATSANKGKLGRDLSGVHSRGGTELDRAITACGAVLGLVDDLEDADDHEKIVVLLTDGAYGDEATAAHQREHELRGARVIVVGIGQDMNGYLEILAANGWFASVSADHRTGEISKKVCDRIATPAFRNARLEMDGLSDQAPRLAPDVYPGVSVELWARAPRPAEGATLRVVTDSGVLAVLPVRVAEDASATSRWAKAHINSLDWDVMTGTADHTEGQARIVAASVRFRVLSKYTAWLAVDRSRTTDTIIPQRIVQPSFDAFDSSLHFSALRSSSMAMPSLRPSRLVARLSVDQISMDLDVLRTYAQPYRSVVLDGDVDTDELTGIVSDLETLLSAGRGSLDPVALSDVLERLRDWLDGLPDKTLGKRTRGKIERRLDKLSGLGAPARNGEWKALRELLAECRCILAAATDGAF